ncbi:MAG TPA: signal recognition particle-docking protein FtsY [Bacilli bacterium]|jgi:fused signal recognition particle receptor|nr:signal recognition particle-docking protein FtsY [Acholeplasmataceae bacterium]OQB62386.1 MAG: Signal recognition particle receptor FtsY [Tenericutes bacterium ADurb.Bin140]HOE77579.1 signal recognition particle-docking protein FtsY [Bacilli bacterium]HON63930.1 signal recognition particle-docking protein FtsY [Bacilli bacterium]HOR96259.1 signal recognition particle-docking protein FtsY [Bacilli bacterium]
MGLFGLFKRKDKENQRKYQLGMKKTRSGLMGKLQNLFSHYNEITEDFFDELTDIFIMADIGVETTLDFIEELKADERVKDVKDVSELQPIIVDKMFELYLQQEIVRVDLNVQKDGLSVFLFVGVNGSGKTTSIAKVAYKLKQEKKKVLLAAGDTFRAGAVDQLAIWAERVGVDIVTKPAGSDPSSVIFDALQKAKKEKYDVLLCDTAGRLQNKTNLMKELEKMHRVIEREVPGAPHETLLVIDATTGQNGLSQAEAFMEVAKITGIILTKLDGTSKGGIVLAIRDKYHIPIKMVGLGEKLDDLEPFDLEEYIAGLFVELEDEDA